MDEEQSTPSWHEAFENAHYDVYEPDTDHYRWAGGSGGGRTDNGSVLIHRIGVHGLVDGHTVRVDTWHDAGLVESVLQETSNVRLEGRHRADTGGGPTTTPPRIERDDRTVIVGDATYRCPGRRLVGATDLWVGQLALGPVAMQIGTTLPAQQIALRICADPANLTRTPPAHR